MYTMCSQTPFTHGSYLGDTASLSIHEAGPRGCVGGKGSTTQRARNPPQGRQVPPGLGVIRTPDGTSRELRGRVCLCPLSVRGPFHSWGWVPPPRPSALPSFPSSPGLCGVYLGWFPTAGRLSALSCSQDQRAREPGSKGVLCLLSGAVI